MLENDKHRKERLQESRTAKAQDAIERKNKVREEDKKLRQDNLGISETEIYKNLAAKFNVSERTIRKDLQD